MHVWFSGRKDKKIIQIITEINMQVQMMINAEKEKHVLACSGRINKGGGCLTVGKKVGKSFLRK